jgi:hypothetical protein
MTQMGLSAPIPDTALLQILFRIEDLIEISPEISGEL